MRTRVALVLLMLLSFHLRVKAQSDKIYTSNDGLPNVTIHQLLEDYKGFIWLATDNGLIRFDGKSFHTYRSNENDSTALQNDYITTLFEDSKNRLWVGTSEGLWQYDATFDRFIRVIGKATWGNYYNYHVKRIIETDDHQLLVATSGYSLREVTKERELKFIRGLSDSIPTVYLDNVFETKQKDLFVYSEIGGMFYKRCNSHSFHHIDLSEKRYGTVKSICQDSNHRILVNATKGLFYFDSLLLQFVTVAGTENQSFLDMYKAINGEIWLTTSKGELCYLNKEGKTTNWAYCNTVSHLPKPQAQALYIDRQKNKWLILKNKGLQKIEPGNPTLANYTSNDQKALCIYVDSKEIWTGYENYGLIVSDRISGKQLAHLFKNQTVNSLYCDKEKTIWAGTGDDGLCMIDKKKYTASKLYKHNPADPTSIAGNNVWCITQDSKGYLWIGIYGKGLCRLDPQKEEFITLSSDFNQPSYQNRLCNNWVFVVYADSDNQLWIGTANGISKLDLNTNIFTSYFTSTNTISGKIVNALTETKQHIWIGTNNGICVYNKRSGKWEQNTLSYFPTYSVNTLITDNNEKIWVCTADCIYQIDPQVQKYRTFTEHDGILPSDFRRESACKTEDGQLFFGGINGVVGFYPQTIAKKQHYGNLVFTELLLFNKTVRVGEERKGKPVITQAIDEAECITVAYEECFITLGFRILDFSGSEETNYLYQMEGYDKQWQEIAPGGEKKATYTNLLPGEYTFTVKACSNGAELTRQIRVLVLPPWWLSWYMKVVYLLLFIAFIYAIICYYNRKNKERMEIQRLDQLAQLNEMKLQFFINISHEIRTPLTLIISPLEKLYHNADTKSKEAMETIYRNAHRLLNLVDQLMDTRKIEKGHFVLHPQRTEMISYIKKLIDDFLFYAQEKNIRIISTSEHDKLFAFIDPNNFQKIISNLLFNALKFSPAHSQITIHITIVHKESPMLHIEVNDQGIGIENNKLKSIFDRFVQIENQKNNQGTGIGLHLCQQLTQLHHGTIWAESKEGTGASFCVEVPLEPTHSLAPIDEDKPEPQIINQTEKKEHTLLIAEDDDDIRSYLKQELSPKYHILECSNGSDALKMILTAIPDLIICDIMMPGEDGITICKRVRSNFNTAHLPIILLTAKVNTESVQEGITAGADEYMTKPFSIELLSMRIKKLIEMRKELEYRYGKEIKFEVQEEVSNNSADDKLKERINKIIRAYLDDSKLNVMFLSREVGLSRVHLNRKMKEFYNMSPHEYIKVTRMKQAGILLDENKLTVSEISYKVGFSSHAHFASSFKDFYGCTPTEYMKKKMMEKPDNNI